MRIALDFDGTFTADVRFWSNFVLAARQNDDDVYIVTFRSPDQSHEILDWLGQGYASGVYYTSGEKKRKFMNDRNIDIDIWIDDQPELIV